MDGIEELSMPGGVAVVNTSCTPAGGRHNEDAAAALTYESGVVLLAVADGVGGHADGDKAAEIAIQSLIEELPDHLTCDDGELRILIMNAIEQANRRLLDRRTGCATTLTVAAINGRSFRAFQVGDSKAVVCGQRGKLRFETIAHSPVGYAVESGLLEEHEAIRHQDLHLVSNIIGSTDMSIDVGPIVELHPRDTILLASDGVFDNVLVREAVDLVRCGHLSTAGRSLLELCRERMSGIDPEHPSKPDDLTFMLYRLTSS